VKISNLVAALPLAIVLAGCVEKVTPESTAVVATAPSPFPAHNKSTPDPIILVPSEVIVPPGKKRRGNLAWKAKFDDSFSIPYRIDGQPPTVLDTDDSKLPGEWGTFNLYDDPSMSGYATVPKYEIKDGMLYLTSSIPGYPLIANVQFSKNDYICVECTMSSRANDPQLINDICAGPCLYNGEPDYRALYFTRWIDGPANKLRLAMYGPTYGFDMNIGDSTIDYDRFYIVRLEYEAAVWTYSVFDEDENLLYSTTEEPFQLSNDRCDLIQDPRPAIWIGGMSAIIKSMEVYTDKTDKIYIPPVSSVL